MSPTTGASCWSAHRCTSSASTRCWDIAAALTYYAVLPVSRPCSARSRSSAVFGSAEAVAEDALHVVRDLGGDDGQRPAREPIDQLLGASQAGLAFVTGPRSPLWTASGYLGTFGRGMNRILGVEEGRPYWKLRPAMLGAGSVLRRWSCAIGHRGERARRRSAAVAPWPRRGHRAGWDLGKLPVLAAIGAS